MKTPVKILVVTALAVVVVGAIALKKGKAPAETSAVPQRLPPAELLKVRPPRQRRSPPRSYPGWWTSVQGNAFRAK
jgi:hypothetical protein